MLADVEIAKLKWKNGEEELRLTDFINRNNDNQNLKYENINDDEKY